MKTYGRLCMYLAAYFPDRHVSCGGCREVRNTHFIPNISPYFLHLYAPQGLLWVHFQTFHAQHWSYDREQSGWWGGKQNRISVQFSLVYYQNFRLRLIWCACMYDFEVNMRQLILFYGDYVWMKCFLIIKVFIFLIISFVSASSKRCSYRTMFVFIAN